MVDALFVRIKSSYFTYTTNMFPASAISINFVMRGIGEGKPISQMKLQKIIYLAQGHYLAKNDCSLIKEDFEAWKWGPVIPEIYHFYKLYGSTPIADDYFIPQKTFENYTDAEIKSMNFAWDVSRNISAMALSNWTHQSDSPWAKYYKMDVTGIIIPKKDIKDYFIKFLNGVSATK